MEGVKMEDFKKKLIHRQILIGAGLLFACFAFIFSSRFEKEETASEYIRSFIDGFQAGLAACIFVFLIFSAVKYFIAINKPDKLKNIYIFETDERRLFIKQKTGNTGLNIVIYGLAVGTVVAGRLNDTVFFSLLGACFFAALVRAAMKLYFHKKY